jgi:hypothetical protein
MLAMAGRTADGIREGERAVALGVPHPNDVNSLYSGLQLVRTYIAAGMKEKAIDGLEGLLRSHYVITPARLRIDPTFVVLKGNPRFEKLLSQPAGDAKP